MGGTKIIIKSVIIMGLIILCLVPFMGLGFCALQVSTVSGYSEEENREILCEECWSSSLFASEILGCNKELLEEQRYYNEYERAE